MKPTFPGYQVAACSLWVRAKSIDTLTIVVRRSWGPNPWIRNPEKGIRGRKLMTQSGSKHANMNPDVPTARMHEFPDGMPW